MGTEKLVDASFLGRLTGGSYEESIGAVDRAVMDNAELFGVSDGSQLRTLATHAHHLIVASVDGDFYRAKWAVNEEGGVTISEVEEIDVPIYEPTSMGVQVREESVQIVGLIMGGKIEEAGERMGGLLKLVKSGVRLTAEGVEDLYLRQSFTEDDWYKATVANEAVMAKYLGNEAFRLSVPKPQFEAIIEAGDLEADRSRGSVRVALKGLRERFDAMRRSLALAREIDPSRHKVRGTANGGMTVADFADFVGGLGEAIDSVIAILSDAEAVSEDGCVKCVARIHDGVASQAYEWALAAAFAEKLARRFEPVAA